jgi:hypothetical protein
MQGPKNVTYHVKEAIRCRHQKKQQTCQVEKVHLSYSAFCASLINPRDVNNHPLVPPSVYLGGSFSGLLILTIAVEAAQVCKILN